MYKKSILIADQKNYIVNLYTQAFNIAMNIAQCIFLVMTHDFVIYCVLNIIFNLANVEKKILQCQEFAKQYYSREKYTLKTIPKANKMYDGFISGSDMIWNLDVNGYDYSYFLDFANEGKKKIAYGSSIGDCWKDTDKSKIKNLLEQYDAVSVREEDTSCYIREAFLLHLEPSQDMEAMV